MKKLLLPVFIFLMLTSARGQVIILCEDFTNYDTLTAAVDYHGWYVSYNHPSNSYYTSTQSSGPSGPNSYKLGVDSATLITPSISTATHIQFWTKGNATDSISTLYVYDTTDSLNWNLLETINPINTNSTGMMRQLTLNPGAIHVKFFYDKSLGNCAFDDFCATIGPAGVDDIAGQASPLIFPNPSNGFITISSGNPQYNSCKVTVLNAVGNVVRTYHYNDLNSADRNLDLSMLEKGIYLIQIKSEKSAFTRRIVLQ